VYDRERKGFSEDDPLLRTGEQRDSYEHDIDGKIAYIGSTLDKALYSELGTSKEPPRPVLLPSVTTNKEKIEALIGNSGGQGALRVTSRLPLRNSSAITSTRHPLNI
jgi:hypothetical protein